MTACACIDDFGEKAYPLKARDLKIIGVKGNRCSVNAFGLGLYRTKVDSSDS